MEKNAPHPAWHAHNQSHRPCRPHDCAQPQHQQKGSSQTLPTSRAASAGPGHQPQEPAPARPSNEACDRAQLSKLAQDSAPRPRLAPCPRAGGLCAAAPSTCRPGTAKSAAASYGAPVAVGLPTLRPPPTAERPPYSRRPSAPQGLLTRPARALAPTPRAASTTHGAAYRPARRHRGHHRAARHNQFQTQSGKRHPGTWPCRAAAVAVHTTRKCGSSRLACSGAAGQQRTWTPPHLPLKEGLRRPPRGRENHGNLEAENGPCGARRKSHPARFEGLFRRTRPLHD